MAKNKILEADLADETAESELDAESGEPLFEDLSPRFVRNLDAAVAKVKGVAPKGGDEEDEDETPDPADEDADEEEEAPADEPSDEDEPAEEVAEDEDADEPRRGNPKFEKRLARADRLLQESRDQIAELQRRDQERAQRDQLAANETEYTTFKSKTEADLARLKKELVAATENAETEKQIDLQDRITDLKAELRAKTTKYEEAKASLETTAKRREISPLVATKVAQWKRRNPRYSTDKEFAAMVNSIDAALIQSGSDNESDDHYRELDKKLRKLYPELAPKVKQRRHPSAQQGAPVTQRAAPAKVTMKGGTLRIAPDKLARIRKNMERFGLDATDANVKEYIRNNPGI